MKILHIENIAGVANTYAIEQNRQHNHATVLETYRMKYTWPHDVELYYEGSKVNILNNMRKVYKFAKKYEVVHIHGGIAKKRLDLRSIKSLQKKPFVVEYHGGESIDGYGMKYGLKLADASIIATPDLKVYHPEAKLILNPFVPEEFSYIMKKNCKPVFAHFPTNRKRKRTDLIVDAFEKLKYDGYNATLKILEGYQNHDDVLKEIKQCDVVIDQMGRGAYGMLSLEALCLNKPVIAYINPDFKELLPGYADPIISINESSSEALYQKIRHILDNGITPPVGVIDYITEYHSIMKQTDRVMRTYEEAMEAC